MSMTLLLTSTLYILTPSTMLSMFCISFPFRCRKSQSKWASLNSRHAMWNQQNSKNILDVGDVVPWMAVKGLLQPSSLRVSSQMSFAVNVRTCVCFAIFACHLDSNFIKAHAKQMFATCGKGLMPQLVEVVANETNRSTCKQAYQNSAILDLDIFTLLLTCNPRLCEFLLSFRPVFQNRFKHVQAVSGSKAQQQ